MTKQVEVLDSLMGCGKTTAIIEWMRMNPTNNYIYISPRLSEVTERIPEGCPELNFKTPVTSNGVSKSEDMLELLKQGENIATTHALYQQLTWQHTQWVALKGYVLIIDEEVDFISSYNKYSTNDLLTLKQEDFISIDYDNGGKVNWLWDYMKPNTAYESLRSVCNLGMLYVTKSGKLKDSSLPDSHIENEMMVTHIPPKLIDVAERVIVLTYNYYGSIMDKFFSLRGYTSKPFDEVTLMKSEQEVKQRMNDLIQLVNTPTTKKVRRWGMSKTWYEKTATKKELELIAKGITSVGRKCNALADELMYTCPKSVVVKNSSDKKSGRMKVERYPVDNCFLYTHCRATNDYRHKTTLVHAFDRHPNTAVERYLCDYGHPVSRDLFALSEMLQWIFRSQIRDDKYINLCIMKDRMERLLLTWLCDFN